MHIVSEISPDILAVGYDQDVPQNFSKVFPHIEFRNIASKNPEQWKSSHYRKKNEYSVRLNLRFSNKKNNKRFRMRSFSPYLERDPKPLTKRHNKRFRIMCGMTFRLSPQ